MSRKDFITDYQSRGSTDRSFTLPDNHLKNQLACYAFYAITQLAYLSQNQIHIYISCGKIMTKKKTRTQHAQ